MKRIRDFFVRKNVKPSWRLYFIDAMGAMALALFSTLLIGTIFSTLATYLGGGFFATVAGYAKSATGVVLGVAVANALKAPPLVLCSAGVAGLAGYDLSAVFLLDGVEKTITAGPAGAFLTAIVAAELGKLVSKETKIDILVTPVVTICSGTLVGMLVCPAIAWAMYWLGTFINTATVMQPVVMGILISVVMGIILTLPISSAAICAMIGIAGLAGGAAAAGCCAQMVGFAVISFRANRWGGLVAQGLGTSMLQMGNIVKKPIIWLPVTLASAVTGPLSTVVFGLECNGVSAGMGTCGLVGPLGILSATEQKDGMFWVGLVLICVVLPALLSLVFYGGMKKLGWLRDEDLKLEL